MLFITLLHTVCVCVWGGILTYVGNNCWSLIFQICRTSVKAGEYDKNMGWDSAVAMPLPM